MSQTRAKSTDARGENGQQTAPTARGPATLAAETRAPGTVRVNRTVFTGLGLLLTAAGAAGLATALGLFDHRLSDQPVLGPTVEDFLAANRWFWPVVAIAAGLLALLCLWWLLLQTRSNRISELRLVADPQRGHTDLTTRALTHAVIGEIEGYHGVSRAAAHLTGTSAAPKLSLTWLWTAASAWPRSTGASPPRQSRTPARPSAPTICPPDYSCSSRAPSTATFGETDDPLAATCPANSSVRHRIRPSESRSTRWTGVFPPGVPDFRCNCSGG